MLIVFRAGPITDNTSKTFDDLDVIDVIPRHKEAVIKARGLGTKATRFFWIEVDTDRLADEAWDSLARRIMEPDREEITTPPTHSIIKAQPPVYRLNRKRKIRLREEELEKLDANFKADQVKLILDAKGIYPKRRLQVNQLNKLLEDKKTGRDLNGN